MKILMVTMALGIGGAETHIVELSKQLKKQGHDILVVSNGGVYERELEKVGIRHFKAPLNRRNLKCMFEGMKVLSRVIREEKPDIVHAHARIPAFLCNLLRKKYHFTFVTSAHGVFDTGKGLKYLTRWGQKTVALSEDLKDYLMDNYGVPPEDIFVTVNGIDTEKFSPEVSGKTAAAEFGLDRMKPILVHVSRLDEHSSLTAQQLIEIMPDLDKQVPGVQLLIVGGGTEFERIKTRSEEINKTLKRRAVCMAGPRTDVNEIVAVCDIFVGVSRAALEAMAEEKPVILSGISGYIGPFTPEKLDIAMETNFCCRGCETSERRLLLRDIAGFFAAAPERRVELGKYGREIAIREYSVKRMADDCLRAYEAARPKRYRITVCGYYGFRNTGDEAILQSIRDSIREHSGDVEVTVLSEDPWATGERYGCHAVNRFNVWAVLRAVHQCDVLLFGGGSLLQDRTSTRSLVYYTSIVRVAKHAGKKVIFYANGIGPVQKEANRRRVKLAAERADIITLRDGDSAEELASMGIPREKLQVTADPAFAITPLAPDASRELLFRSGVAKDEKFIVVSVREWPGIGDFADRMASLCDRLTKKFGCRMVFVIMQPSHDLLLSREIRNKMREKAFLLEGNPDACEIMGVISQAELVISVRLHTLIFAAHAVVPAVGLVYDPKVRSFLTALGMPNGGDVTQFDPDRVEEIVGEALENRESYCEALRPKAEALTAQARRNEELLFDLLRQAEEQKTKK